MPVCSKDTQGFFSCEECTRAFTRRGQLNRHLKKHEDPSTWFTCEACTYKSYQKSNVALHAKAKHGKRPKKQHKHSTAHLADDLRPTRHSIEDSQHPRSQSDAGMIGTSSTLGVQANDPAKRHEICYRPPPGPPPHLHPPHHHVESELLPLALDSSVDSTAVVHRLSPPSSQWCVVDSKSTQAEVSNPVPPHIPTPAGVYDPPPGPPPGYEKAALDHAIKLIERWEYEPTYPPPGPPGAIDNDRIVSIHPQPFEGPMKNAPFIHHRPVFHVRLDVANGTETEAVQLGTQSASDPYGNPFLHDGLGAMHDYDHDRRPKDAKHDPFKAVVPSHTSARPQSSTPPWDVGSDLQHNIVKNRSTEAGLSHTMQPMYSVASPTFANVVHTTAHSAPPNGAMRMGHSHPPGVEGPGASSYYY